MSKVISVGLAVLALALMGIALLSMSDNQFFLAGFLFLLAAIVIYGRERLISSES